MRVARGGGTQARPEDTGFQAKAPGGRTQRGSAIVESTFLLLPLLAMILFILDMGRVLLAMEYITERARIGARSAVVNNWTSDQTANFICYNSTSAPAGGNGTPGLLGLVPSTQVSYSLLGASGDPDYRVKVSIHDVPLVTFIPYMAGNYTVPKITVTAPAQSFGATN